MKDLAPSPDGVTNFIRADIGAAVMRCKIAIGRSVAVVAGGRKKEQESRNGMCKRFHRSMFIIHHFLVRTNIRSRCGKKIFKSVSVKKIPPVKTLIARPSSISTL